MRPMLSLKSSMKPVLAATAAAFMLGSVASVPVYAAGDSNTTVRTPTCKKNFAWDKRKKRCVKVKKSSGLDDNNIYEAARDLAYYGRYEEAINLLKLASNQNDPRILNYLGYSNRKLGRVDTGLKYYTAALKADPDYTLVREYMGEAFLQKGDVKKAQEQLAEIRKLCGTSCREYTMLKAEITKFKAAVN